jgi:putative DNA primase/helicase
VESLTGSRAPAARGPRWAGNSLTSQVEETISSNYGVLMPGYLRELVPLRAELPARLRGIIDEFVDEMHANNDPWERRFARKFGIVLAAALLLSEFGLTPWTKKRARIAVRRVYKRSRAASASVKEAADALLRRLKKLVRAGTRFPAIKKGQSLPADQAKKAWGVIWKLPEAKRTILIPYSRLESLVMPSAITGAVLHELAAREILLKADDGKLTRQVMIKGLAGDKKPRYVCLSKSAMMKKG